MRLRDKISEDLIAAMKAKEAVRNKEIDTRQELEDTQVLQVLISMIKQRKDSIEQFAKGGRTDLVEKEEAELKVVQEFMPAQMSDDEVENIIKKTIAEAGAVSVKDMGRVMKILMPQL